MIITTEWLQALLRGGRREEDNYGYKSVEKAQRINCVDGFSMSVQASSFHYCTPRENYTEFWSEVEVGFPSEVEGKLVQWAENLDDLTGTVYGYVPVKIVVDVINSHGGVPSN